MAIYILNAETDAGRGAAIEKRLRDITSDLIKIRIVK